MSPFGHQRHQEALPVCTVFTVFSKAMEESWGQGMPVTLESLSAVPDYICLCLTMLARQREGTKNGTVRCLHS